MKITPEIQEKYLEDPNTCPFCDGDRISTEEFNSYSSSTAFRIVNCDHCGAEWEENYTLTSISSQEEIPAETMYPLRNHYWTPFDQYKEHIGKLFSIIGFQSAADAEEENSVPLFRIKLETGEEIDAWEEEIFAIPTNIGE